MRRGPGLLKQDIMFCLCVELNLWLSKLDLLLRAYLSFSLNIKLPAGVIGIQKYISMYMDSHYVDGYFIATGAVMLITVTS